MVAGIPVVMGLEARIEDPYVYVVFHLSEDLYMLQDIFLDSCFWKLTAVSQRRRFIQGCTGLI